MGGAGTAVSSYSNAIGPAITSFVFSVKVIMMLGDGPSRQEIGYTDGQSDVVILSSNSRCVYLVVQMLKSRL